MVLTPSGTLGTPNEHHVLLDAAPSSPNKGNQLSKGELIGRYISDLNSNPKDFIIELLTSNNNKMPERQRYWSSERGLDSTMKVLDSIKGVVNSKDLGRDRWREWIFKEVC